MTVTASRDAGAVLARRGPDGQTVATIVTGLVGALFFVLSFAYDWRLEDGSVGPAVLPRTASALLVLVSVARLVLAARRPAAAAAEPAATAVEADDAPVVEEVPHARRKLLLVCATVLVTALAIPYLGLLVTLGVMTLFLAAYVERQPLLRSLAVAVGTLAVSYLVFVVLLQIPLPWGLLDPAVWEQ
ncbi:tripartite tricarboxylate transporter TctB family protein [Kineococcus sp. SYSU DK003]|uniref:tripartite tricarboxylate transporter TctB family protein n=1 Tax=Kineococcus sp. SYSU DK003 TaxID=3383124 RepID=UPI003D7C65C9